LVQKRIYAFVKGIEGQGRRNPARYFIAAIRGWGELLPLNA
jgi:hypothetical protein